MSSLTELTGGEWRIAGSFATFRLPRWFWRPGVLVAIVPPAVRN
jgi:hypothetical protein